MVDVPSAGPPPSWECLIWAERTGGTSGIAALWVEMDCEAELQDVGFFYTLGEFGDCQDFVVTEK